MREFPTHALLISAVRAYEGIPHPIRFCRLSAMKEIFLKNYMVSYDKMQFVHIFVYDGTSPHQPPSPELVGNDSYGIS